MNTIDKKKIVRSSITQAGVPVLFDSVIESSEIYTDPVQVTITENGVTTIKAEDIDREEREAQGLTPYDGMSTVEVTVDVPAAPGGPVTSFEDPIVFDSIEDAEELNSYDVKGALISYNASTGKYTAWNGEADLDARAWDYRADATAKASGTITMSGNLFASGWSEDVEFPTNEYGEVIAVCVGDGFWVSTKWDSTASKKWCKQDGTLYSKQQDCLSLSGVECTANLLSRVTSEDESLFWDVKEFGADDNTQYHWYVPSKYEIFPAIINQGMISEDTSKSYIFTTALAQACHLITGYYWSSSQSTNGPEDAYRVYSAYSLGNYDKYGTYACLVLLRFGAALASAESN